jgi:hypothetical protein
MLPRSTLEEVPVVDFNALAGKAGELLIEHADQVEAATEKIGEVVKEKYGHDEQVDMAVDKIKDLIPGGGSDEAPGPAPAGH